MTADMATTRMVAKWGECAWWEDEAWEGGPFHGLSAF